MVRKVFPRALALMILVTGLSACESLSMLGLWRHPSREPPREGAPYETEAPPRTTTFALAEDSDLIGELRAVIAHHEDTLLDIARQYGVGYEEITDANPGVDPWLPGEGTTVLLPTQFVLPDAPRRGIVLNLAALRLFYFPTPKQGEDAVVITHPIGIGREGWVTPLGLAKVIAKVKDPVWTVPASIRAEHAKDGDPLPPVVPPGPDNPLGRFALRLSIPSYLIHGTNKPSGIGMRVSHGCIQLYPEDIASLFPQVPVGTEVRIVNQPYLAGWHWGSLYLEVHEPLEEERRAWGASLKPMERVLNKALNNAPPDAAPIDWDKAAELAGLRRGIPVPIAPGSPDIHAVVAGAPLYRPPAADTSVSEPGAGEAPAAEKQWYVQAGSFRRAANAQRLAALIGHLGPPIPARYVPVGDGYHQVLAGPFASLSEAQENAHRIRTSLGAQVRILRPGNI